MGTLMKSEFLEEIKAGLGNRDDITDARYLRLLNQAQTRMARAHIFNELETTAAISFVDTGVVADDAVVAIPASIFRIWSIRIDNDLESNKLQYVTPRDWDRTIPDTTAYARNQPRLYTRWSTNIEIYPLADQTYNGTVRGSKAPTVLVNDTDKSDFVEKDDLLITLTLVLCNLSLALHDRAVKHWRIYVAELDRARANDDKRPDGDIIPSFESMTAYVGGEYWRDPFIRSIHGV